jgi:tetratricopeptide (TPR) repeat protein
LKLRSAFFFRQRETVDQTIERLVKEHKTNLIEDELRKFDPRRLETKEKETWYFYWGATAFRRGDRAEAFRRFNEAFANCPESDRIRFSLGQEYEAKGEPEKMAEMFRSCHFPDVSSRHLLTASRYCYLWNRLDNAIYFLRPIFEAYFNLRVADDNFLYMRGLPFFGETWSYFLCYSILQRDFQELKVFTQRAKAELSDYDFDRLLLYLECWESGDFDPKIQQLEMSLTHTDPSFPNGYQQVQLVSLKSLRQPSGDPLAAVRLSERDFPWLADVLLIHEARLAHVAGDELKENQIINIFFQRQPLLFEPDHVANFAVVSYQEDLKPRYQETRRAPAV